MEPDVSLHQSKFPIVIRYPEPPQSNPFPNFHCLKFHLNIIFSSKSGSSKWSLSLTIPLQILYTSLPSPIRAAWPTQYILPHLISCKIFVVIYRSQSSSLFCFLNSPTTLSLLGPNIPLRTSRCTSSVQWDTLDDGKFCGPTHLL